MLLVIIFFLLAAFSGSANPIFIRFALPEIPPLTYTALRFLGAALIFFPFWYRERKIINFKEFYKLLPYTLNMTFYALGIQYTSVTMAALLYTLAPVLTAFLGYLFLKEKVSKAHIIGLLLAIFGVFILIGGSLQTNDIRSFGMPLGNLLVLIGVISWGFYPVGARSLSKKYSNSTILFHTFILTSFILFLLLPIEWRIRPLEVSKISHVAIFNLLGAIVIGTSLFYFCYQWFIRKTTAFVASLNLHGGFVAAVIYGAIFFGEYFTLKLLVGSTLVIFGVFLATGYTQLRKGKEAMLQ